MAGKGPQNCRRGLERCLPLGFLVSIQKWPKNAFSWFLLTRIWIFVRHRKCPRFWLWKFGWWSSTILWTYVSFKFHKDPSFHWGDVAKICSAGVFASPLDKVKRSPVTEKTGVPCLPSRGDSSRYQDWVGIWGSTRVRTRTANSQWISSREFIGKIHALSRIDIGKFCRKRKTFAAGN